MGGSAQVREWRRFVTVEGRAVHVRGMGEGPPALLIHSSPANSSFLLADMRALAGRHSCFAFDTPGFGLSDPLPGDTLTVADLADATAAAMVAIGLPRCPVYGTHTGAAIALELGARHPDRVSGLVLDGVPVFTPGEAEMLVPGNSVDLSPDPLGGHFSRMWTRLRDQSIWFPWFARSFERLNEYDLAPPAVTHRWMLTLLDALDHYRPAYSAAMRYGEGALAAVEALRIPVIFTAADTDMLRPHLARLPALRDRQEVRMFGTDHAAKHALVGEGFARFAGDGPAPPLPAILDPAIGRQFVDAAHGPMLVRHAGSSGAPLLLLHAVPGSGRELGALADLLGKDRRVIVPDLPGSGETLGLPAPTLNAYAAMLLDMLGDLGIAACDVVGFGFSTALALRMARLQPGRIGHLFLAGVPLPDEEERAYLMDRIAPPIIVAQDGSHWFRLWQQLRDGLVWWPWFDCGRATLRREPADFGARRLSDWTRDVMRQHDHYGDLVRAALSADVADDLRALRHPPTILAGPADPMSRPYDAPVLALRPDARLVSCDGSAAGLAVAIAG